MQHYLYPGTAYSFSQHGLAGAEKGARRAEKEVTLAQDALTRAKTEEEVSKQESIIARESRYASLEREQIALLNVIAKEDAKK